MTGVKGRSGRKKKVDPAQTPSPASPVPQVSPVPPVSTSVSGSGGFVSSAPIPPQAEPAKEPPKPETPKIEFTAKQEDSFKDVEDLKDLFGKLKPPEDVERERQETDKMLDGLFQSIENVWNRAGETNERGEIEAWRWTKSDSQQLKNSIMLLDAKYGFIGKSINYMPEILFAVTLLMIGMKGIALMRHRRESQRPNFSAPPAPVPSPITNLTQLAEQRARELGGG